MKEQILMTLECKGPGVAWSSLTVDERFNWMFIKDTATDTCGESTVIIDTSIPDDFWPEYCPKCGTDVNWDISVVEKMQMLELKLNGHMI